MIITETKDHDSLIDFYISRGIEFDETKQYFHPPIFSYIAEIDGKFVGCITICKEANDFILDEVAVVEDMQGRGICKALVQKSIDRILSEFGESEFYLVAKNFEVFQSMGFKIISREEAPSFSECFNCPDFEKICFPKVMKITLTKRSAKHDLSTIGIIEIGSNNTKTHIYKAEDLIADYNVTIEFKKNYKLHGKILASDIDKLCVAIEDCLKITQNVYLLGCSIFRNITENELNEINQFLNDKYGLEILVVSQEDEANFTAFGCCGNLDYDKNICVFIGGGGSIELMFFNNKQLIKKQFYNFGVVDVTNKFSSLKEDIPTCTFEEVYNYVDDLIGELEMKADILILAGGDHLYWYNNAKYKLLENSVYQAKNHEFMITREMSDNYDKDALKTSLTKIRENSDNPLWFDGSRAMKVITNNISHKVDAKYIIPTKINMEEGFRQKIINP